MAQFISLLRVRDAVLNLQQWKELVDSQGCKHLMHFLAAKRGGVNAADFVDYAEANDFSFCDSALKVRPGKEPYYDPLDGEFRIDSHPHSNIATARKKTFKDAWKAAEMREKGGSEQWKFAKNYVAILKDKVISKGGQTSPIPVYDLCAWLYRSTECPDDTTLKQILARFKADYNLTPEEFQTFFTETQLDGTAEDDKSFFTKHQTSDSMLLEMLKDPVNYDLTDAIAAAYSSDKRGPITEDDVVELLTQGRKQLALQGPPGTGKTYLAKRAAATILGVLDDPSKFQTLFVNINAPLDDNVKACAAFGGWSLVQFHPSYTYEDFVRGLSPEIGDETATFAVKDRTFVQISEIARRVRPKPVVLIIDEINRGDLSKVLGELVYGLEYRNHPVSLQYAKSGEQPFSVPDNLLIITTLNTADRSIANIDYAIRRRFDFITLAPDRSVIDRAHSASAIRDGALALFDAVESMFGSMPEIAVGHSYFLATDADAFARTVVFQVLPLLAEYRVEGFLGDADAVRLPNWPGKSGLPLVHERPFELVKSVALWLETYTHRGDSGSAQE